MDTSMLETYDPEEEEEINQDLDFNPTESLPSTGNMLNDFPILTTINLNSYKIKRFENNDVYIKDEIFSKNPVSWTKNGGKVWGYNKGRMATGRAAIGIDNKPINLHHIYQTQNGPIIELLQSFHQANYSALHKNTGQSKSLIDRGTFASWRRRYWQNR